MAEELSRVQCVLKSQIDPESLAESYTPLNEGGFSDTVKILKIYNPSTTVAIDISLNGVDDHDFIPPLSTLIVDFQTNHYDSASYGNGTLNLAKGQILWGKPASRPTWLQIVGYR